MEIPSLLEFPTPHVQVDLFDLFVEQEYKVLWDNPDIPQLL